MATVAVELGDRSYDVQVGKGLLAGLGAFIRQCAPKATQAVVIADSTVAGLYGRAACDAIAAQDLPATLLQFPAGESNKTLATFGQLMDQLLRLAPPIDRRCVIVALGGGVTGDISGFVAATALRGLQWLQCPTTLLAAVDASVGGKTAVDHPAGKSLIGAFHQPRGVLIDVRTFASLPPAQLSNGLAECVKHGVIRDAGLLDFIEDNLQAIVARDEDVLVELVRRNVEIKAAVVSADEREAGERAHLNLGHTVGHAIETLVGYDRIGHGDAVSLGMVAACRMAVRRGLLEDEAAGRVRDLLKALGLPVKFADLAAGAAPAPRAIWQLMQHDKKAIDGQVRMVLPTTLGSAAVFDDITEEQVAAAVLGL